MKLGQALPYAKAHRLRAEHNSQYHGGRPVSYMHILPTYLVQKKNRYEVHCPDCTEATWESLGRGFIDWPEPDQTYGADGE